MAEPEMQMTVTLLTVAITLLLIGLLTMFWIARRLSRIERLVTRLSSWSGVTEPAPSVAETSVGGAFESFLSEDPERRSLTKTEQFTAYRQWRQEKGMNWST